GFATIFWVSVVSAVTSVAVPVSCAVVEASAAAGGAAESFIGFEGFFGGVAEPWVFDGNEGVVVDVVEDVVGETADDAVEEGVAEVVDSDGPGVVPAEADAGVATIRAVAAAAMPAVSRLRVLENCECPEKAPGGMIMKPPIETG
ncbi:hypothetical protein ABH920_009367, partial [Catenulispora sp. EB89]|uniref:hypothetical protein n=1 Tax=Catenulispora sp. EB89 TaxID=3156257 RepID=UPI0035192F32